MSPLIARAMLAGFLRSSARWMPNALRTWAFDGPLASLPIAFRRAVAKL